MAAYVDRHTGHENRLMGCTLEEDRDLLRRGRGSFDFGVDNDAKIAVVKWADNKTVTLDFRLDVAKGLIYPEKQKRGRPSKGNEDNTPPRVSKQPKDSRPVDDMRYDGIDHFPIVSVKGRCRMCQDGQTSIVCQKCKVKLCIVTGQNPRNCFHSFHCQ
ncbi:hypothetical protein ABVT39_009157 [Epinephelus coioides]